VATMKAAVIYEPGGPEVLKIESRPVRVPQLREVLIRVKAFGLNRSELFTRQGLSPGVIFPRILGIEAVGLVEEVPGAEFSKGDIVATAMGGMGRDFDGGYAEYTCVPARQVQVVKTGLPWETLGAIPEMCRQRGARCSSRITVTVYKIAQLRSDYGDSLQDSATADYGDGNCGGDCGDSLQDRATGLISIQ
jgi:D-arabinose 1-dehydrogenase-like Zn-dependent alcohol dehydrogenase